MADSVDDSDAIQVPTAAWMPTESRSAASAFVSFDQDSHPHRQEEQPRKVTAARIVDQFIRVEFKILAIACVAGIAGRFLFRLGRFARFANIREIPPAWYNKYRTVHGKVVHVDSKAGDIYVRHSTPLGFYLRSLLPMREPKRLFPAIEQCLRLRLAGVRNIAPSGQTLMDDLTKYPAVRIRLSGTPDPASDYAHVFVYPSFGFFRQHRMTTSYILGFMSRGRRDLSNILLQRGDAELDVRSLPTFPRMRDGTIQAIGVNALRQDWARQMSAMCIQSEAIAHGQLAGLWGKRLFFEARTLMSRLRSPSHSHGSAAGRGGGGGGGGGGVVSASSPSSPAAGSTGVPGKAASSKKAAAASSSTSQQKLATVKDPVPPKTKPGETPGVESPWGSNARASGKKKKSSLSFAPQ
eukprot:Rmarinus@m.9603